MTTIVSLDCESNGLHGSITAAAATLQVDGREVDTWVARAPLMAPVDPWYAEHVNPAIGHIPVTHASYAEMLNGWIARQFDWRGPRDTPAPLIVCNCPWPVEARFLWRAHHDVPFSGPYPLIDVASMLAAIGADPLDESGYLASQGIAPPEGVAHDPLYDARRTAQAYWSIVSR